ncbi:MAG: integrase, partial [Gammaproteobacteria bacterium]
MSALEQLRALLEGTGESRFQVRWGRRRALLAPPGGAQARFFTSLDLPSAQARAGRTTGYSRQQLTGLVRQWLVTGGLTKRRPPAQGFARKYTVADVALLAETDALHDTLLGPATQHLMQRSSLLFGDTRTARLASISVA